MVREVVQTYLERDGFEVTAVEDGREALDHITSNDPDLVILDVMLPEIDGFTVLRRLRDRTNVPVILLTARGDEPDRVLGLELGADDYVPKPFSPRELTARVRSVLRRSTDKPESDVVEFGSLTIDNKTRQVTIDDDLIELTRREYELLAYLASSPGQVFSRAQLLEHVWDSSADWQDPATVTVHVRRLRQKLDTSGDGKEWIHTVWGVGYRFEP